MLKIHYIFITTS